MTASWNGSPRHLLKITFKSGGKGKYTITHVEQIRCGTEGSPKYSLIGERGKRFALPQDRRWFGRATLCKRCPHQLACLALDINIEAAAQRAHLEGRRYMLPLPPPIHAGMIPGIQEVTLR